MYKLGHRGLILFGILLVSLHAVAQNTCSTLVDQAITSTAEQCVGMGRNQVCYGNVNVNLIPQPDAPTFTFEQVGDTADVTYMRSLKLAPLNEAQGIWGIAMMQLQADIPDTTPGQNVTFILFGDVEIGNTPSNDRADMQAFYLRTGVGDAACVEAPARGVLIQTPEGVESVHFNVNGMDVEIGSTVMLQAAPAQQFTIQTLEGAAVVTIAGRAFPVIAGTTMSIPIDAQMNPRGLPNLPVPLSETDLQALPVTLLPRPIPPITSLTDESTAELQSRLQAGLDPCGVAQLPSCEHALRPHADRIWAMQSDYADAFTSNAIIVLEGPVKNIVNNVISIYDFEITVEPQHPILSLIDIGDVVHIEGTADSEGIIAATAVSNLSNVPLVNGATVSLAGPVEAIDSSSITVNGISVQLGANDPLLQTVEVGQFVNVQGNFQGSGPNIVLSVVNIAVTTNGTVSENNCRSDDDGMGMGHWHCDTSGMGDPGMEISTPGMGMGDPGMGNSAPGMGMGMGGG
jgi:hypothetical protein